MEREGALLRVLFEIGCLGFVDVVSLFVFHAFVVEGVRKLSKASMICIASWTFVFLMVVALARHEIPPCR